MEPLLTPLPVRDARCVERATFEAEILSCNEPIVLRGLVENWPAVAAARRSPQALVDYLQRHDAGIPLSTYVGPADIGGRFFYRDDLRGFNFDRGRALFTNVARMLIDALDRSDPAPAIYSGAASASDHFPGFAAENPMPLLDPGVMPRLWIGNATTISTHYDNSANLACVAAGTRRFTLFPPEQVGNLYVGPLENTISGQPVSMVDPQAPDFDRYPRYVQALQHALTAELEPGDAIYVPSLWWHHVRATSRFNLLINYWWSAPEEASGFDVLIHGLLAIRDLPRHERQAWRAFFDHYVFGDDAGKATHLPEHARGILGPASPARTALMRDFLAKTLQRGQ